MGVSLHASSHMPYRVGQTTRRRCALPRRPLLPTPSPARVRHGGYATAAARYRSLRWSAPAGWARALMMSEWPGVRAQTTVAAHNTHNTNLGSRSTQLTLHARAPPPLPRPPCVARGQFGARGGALSRPCAGPSAPCVCAGWLRCAQAVTRAPPAPRRWPPTSPRSCSRPRTTWARQLCTRRSLSTTGAWAGCARRGVRGGRRRPQRASA